MYQPSIPVNNKLPVEKQLEITDIILSRYFYGILTPQRHQNILLKC